MNTCCTPDSHSSDNGRCFVVTAFPLGSVRDAINRYLTYDKLDEYDEYELLMLAMGRCAQDDYYLVPIDEKDLPDEIPDKILWI